MTEQLMKHATFVLERHYDALPERVFGAYADVEMRTRWGTPSENEALEYSASDFRVGGADRYRCGPKHDLKYVCDVHYEDIVPHERLVFVERVAEGERPLSVSLVTWALKPEDGGTKLIVTNQMVSFVGAGMVEGATSGTSSALDNLGKWLRPPDRQQVR